MIIAFLFFAVYLGRSYPHYADLSFLKSRATNKKFQLLERLHPHWKEIGRALGIEPEVLEAIEDEERQHARRTKRVLDKWMKNAASLPNHAKYPLSWQGLCNLICAIGRQKVAEEYFDFLSQIS